MAHDRTLSTLGRRMTANRPIRPSSRTDQPMGAEKIGLASTAPPMASPSERLTSPMFAETGPRSSGSWPADNLARDPWASARSDGSARTARETAVSHAAGQPDLAGGAPEPARGVSSPRSPAACALAGARARSCPRTCGQGRTAGRAVETPCSEAAEPQWTGAAAAAPIGRQTRSNAALIAANRLPNVIGSSLALSAAGQASPAHPLLFASINLEFDAKNPL
jgi:hypothetical protein